MTDSSKKSLLVVAFLGIICVLAELAYAVVNVLAIPAFVSKQLGFGEQVGIIMGAFLLAEAVGRPMMGAISDRYGRKSMMAIGALTSGIASVALVFTTSYPLVLLVRIIDGLGAAAFWPSIFAAVGDATTGKNRSTGMSVLNVSYMVGLAFGPLAGGWANRVASGNGNPVYDAAFYLSFGLFVATALLSLILLPKYRPGSALSAEVEKVGSVRELLQAGASVWRLLVLAAITFLGIGCLIPVIELYALDKFNLTQQQFGELFLLPACVIALAAVPLGRLGDRWGRLTSIRIGMFICASALWIAPRISNYHALTTGSILLGFGFLLAFPAWMALVADVTSEERRGSVLGAAGMAQGFGAILGAAIGGMLYHVPPYSAHSTSGMSKFLNDIGVIPHDAPFVLAAIMLTTSFVLTFVLLSRYSRTPAR